MTKKLSRIVALMLAVMREFILRLAGIDIAIDTRFEDTFKFFHAFGETYTDSDHFFLANTRIPDRDWEEYLGLNMEDCAHTEYSMLTPHCSDVLLAFDRVIIHAVAIRWKEKAYLICAKSGTGKSTQAKYLQALRKNEFEVICGDRPVLEFCHSEQSEESATHDFTSEIIVHPSPWNGKENWHGGGPAPLAGLILLERGEKNALFSLSENEAIIPVYPHFIQTAWKTDSIRKIAELETKLLRNVPIWKLISYKCPDSTKLLLDAVFTA